MVRHKWRSCNKFGVIPFFSVPTARVGTLLEVYVPRAYKDYWPPQYYNSTAYLTCKQQKHYTSRERLLSIILSHRHKVAALGPQHSTYPTRHSGAAGLRGTGTSLRAHYCTRAFGTKEGDFSSRIYLPSATYLNLVNAEFFRAGHFFLRAVRVGKPFILLLRRY